MKIQVKISTRRVIAIENNYNDFYTKADTRTYIEPGVVKREILSVVQSSRFHILVWSFQNSICMDPGVILYDCFCLTGITAWNTFVELKKKRRRTQKFL